MNYYCIVFRNIDKNLSIEDISKYLPNNVIEAGFICQICGNAMMKDNGCMCDLCEGELMPTANMQILVFTVPKDMDLNSYERDSLVYKINDSDLNCYVSLYYSFFIYSTMERTLSPVFRNINGIYSFY